MPKSYKICPVSRFDVERFSDNPYKLKQQLVIADVPPPPETLIRKSSDGLRLEDFSSFIVEHERVVRQWGRINDTRFSEFIRKGEISAYFSQARELLLLCGKKDDILDFCRVAASSHEVSFSTISIDMKALLAKLQDVRLVWFKYDDTVIHASALAGQHIETTRPFKEAREQGDISTLSFYLEDSVGIAHPILVTSDGAIVLQANYAEKAAEIELVLRVKQALLDGIYSVVQNRRKTNAAR
ncbi:MAG TPA: hypothetical protein VIB39_19990 [Candidatus Angelobacter sp.]|jgi:hypothetical protein